MICFFSMFNKLSIQSLKFTGVAEQVLVGCVFTGPSSSSEIASFKFNPTHFLMDEEDPVISGIVTDYRDQCEDVVESPAIEFDCVNPHNAAYRTVVMRNFRYSMQAFVLEMDILG